MNVVVGVRVPGAKPLVRGNELVCPVSTRGHGFQNRRTGSGARSISSFNPQQTRAKLAVRAGVGPEAGAGLSPELKGALETFVTENKIVAFIKGTKQFPQCGFSDTVVKILNQMDVPYVTVNVLEDDRIRNGMKEFSQWPTFPQIYIDGEFFGGCDIALEAYRSGELQEVVERALIS